MPDAEEPSASKRKTPYNRSRWRSESHASAHAADVTPPPAPSERPKQKLVPHGEASLVTTNESLAELLAHLRVAGSFAYDSEFIGELTYIPKLCVIQVASAERVGLIDPLAPDLELRPFWELLADASVEKIVHAGAQDVEPVIRNLGRPPANLFDTQIAAGFVGMAYPVALSRLVLELVGARLGKGLTFTHWDQRPLSSMQLRYAADDVRFLPAVRARLGEMLAARGDAPAWAREEFDSLCDPSNYGFDPETYYKRVRGATSLAPQQAAVLRELTVWRDACAREHNVPSRSFVRDEVLIELSRSPVKTVDKLSRVRGLPRPVEAANGAQIIEATQRALSIPPDRWPNLREPDRSPTERFNADSVWAVVQCLCIGRSIDPALVTSRQEIGELYRFLVETAAPKTEPDLRILKGWRRTAIAAPLVEMVKRGSKLTFEWKDGTIGLSRGKV